MSKSQLQEWLLENSGFIAQYRALVMDSVARQFTNLERNSEAKHDWDYLLICASLMAQSDQEECQDVALRIAQYCIQHHGDTKYLDAAAAVLDSLANTPAIQLAERRRLISEHFQERLPYPLFLDWTRRSIEYSVALSDDRFLNVNRFQKQFWNDATVCDWVSLSAPTSAGKSYIVAQWIGEYLRKNAHSQVLYIVPTRALIQQVERDLLEVFAKKNIAGVSVVTLPLRSSIEAGQSTVMVFTQERFHILLAERISGVSIDLLIIDEAHKIGDNYRGVLLQQAIEVSIYYNPQCKVVFASPMTGNPEVLLEDAPDTVSTAEISREDTMVNQNLLWATEVSGRSKVWNLELILPVDTLPLGTFSLPARPTPESKRLPFVAYALGNSVGGNVIYVNGAADAEKAAKQLYDLLGPPVDPLDSEISDLLEVIEKTVHREYSLCDVLRRRIAFHYGNIPLLIRSEIERLFRCNKIRYLICTSTLLEGVNMPCQSLFVRGPTKGRGRPLTSGDFWNLAGRAGRWGKEFQGNIVCVDARQVEVWKGPAPRLRKRFQICRTADQVINKDDALLSFIDAGTPRDIARTEPNLEYVFSYLVSVHLRNGSIESAAWAGRFPARLIATLGEKIAEVVEGLSTPHDVVLRNPGISPIAMDSLLSYFKNRTEVRRENLEGLLPVPAESETAWKQYIQILHRINRHLGKDVFGRGNRVKQLALLVVDWMRGYPLARMISNRVRHYGRDGLATIIRSTMKDVEEIARFQAPKFLSCYVDLLRVYLEGIDRHDLLERVFDLNVLLEFGVSQKTQLALMGLGLSRTSTIALSELITADNLTEAECLAWLRENDWMTRDLPALVKREIGGVLEMHSSTACS